jgi:Ornithine/acetylornithine aminotransferase
VIAFRHSFHGRTSAAVKITDNPKIVSPINDTFEVAFLDLNDSAAVEKELQKGDVCAVVIEGISGVGGIHVPEESFLSDLRRLTTQYGAVLILDEIQSGYGRSGKFFAHQYAGIKPDIITMAKGIANGYPFAGVLISPMFTPRYGMLGTTFGGNHLGCAAALAVLDVIESEHLIENAAQVGAYLLDKLKRMTIPGILEVRGRGLMIGLEFKDSAVDVRKKLLYEQHVFTGAAGTNVIRLLPPLCLTKEQADLFLARFEKALQ